MTQEDIILLIASGSTGPYGLDPVRMMKGCVIAAERGPEQWNDLFSFRPFDWGPFDVTVYRARDALVAQGLLQVDRAQRYERYTPTDTGSRRVADLTRDEPRGAEWLGRVGNYVSSKAFGQLLREIYEAFPAYAVRSRFAQ